MNDDRRLTVVHGALALLTVLLIVQMWLLAATLESYLAGHEEAAGPGVAVSGFLLLTAIAIDRLIPRYEHRGE